MDPDEALRLIREAAANLDDDDDGAFTDPETTNLGQLINAFEALDEWLSKGGFLPAAWSVPGTPVVQVYQRPGDEGCGYTLRLPSGEERTLGDAEADYWAIANIIDGRFSRED